MSEQEKVIDLMAALKESIAKTKGPTLVERLREREDAGYQPVLEMSPEELAAEAVATFQHCDEDPCICEDAIADLFAAQSARIEALEALVREMRAIHERDHDCLGGDTSADVDCDWCGRVRELLEGGSLMIQEQRERVMIMAAYRLGFEDRVQVEGYNVAVRTGLVEATPPNRPAKKSDAEIVATIRAALVTAPAAEPDAWAVIGHIEDGTWALVSRHHTEAEARAAISERWDAAGAIVARIGRTPPADHTACKERAEQDRERIRELTAMQSNDPWLWETDGDNDLAGLASDCPILIMPRTLERLLAEAGTPPADTAPAADGPELRAALARDIDLVLDAADKVLAATGGVYWDAAERLREWLVATRQPSTPEAETERGRVASTDDG